MTFISALSRYKTQLFVLMGLLVLLYAPVISPMVRQWYNDENFSHGFIVPVVSGYFIYNRWNGLKDLIVNPWKPGLLVIIAGLCQLLLGWIAIEYFTMRSSLVTVISGLVLYFFGKYIYQYLLLPINYLLLMVPVPYIIYDSIAFPLKLFVTKISVFLLQIIGVVVLSEGNIIMFPSTTLEVADACSGIRSLMSLIALSVAFSFIIKTSLSKRWIIIISAIPIAIATNALRVIVTGILAQWWGAKAAEGFFHEFAGLAIFALAMALLIGLGALLTRGKVIQG